MTAAADTFFVVVGLALVALLVILFFELKSTQRRLEEVRSQVDQRVRQGLSEVAEPIARIPAMEHRLQEIEREVAGLAPVTEEAEPAARPEPAA